MEQQILKKEEFIKIITKYFKFKFIPTNDKRYLTFIKNDYHYLNINNDNYKYEITHCSNNLCGVIYYDVDINNFTPLYKRFPIETRSYKISKLLK